MAHLIELIEAEDNPLSVGDVLIKIRKAHDYLVRQGIEALRTAQATEESPYWGAIIKRIRVKFPEDDRPDLIAPTIRDHNLTEIYNQCATIERLIDALEWAQKEIPDYKVVLCHPTTSRRKGNVKPKKLPDNDLVLVNAQGGLACFEVSDVVSREADGNSKERKDLISLGVLASDSSLDEKKQWLARLSFLVVSNEFAALLVNKRHSDYSYQLSQLNEQTTILKVLCD